MAELKILLISQSFMAPHIGEGENNFGGTEAFINNFCLAYHQSHKITVFSMADATCSLDEVNLVKCGNYSRAYLEEQSGAKARCNNGGLVNLLNQYGTEKLSQFDMIIDNTCNKTIYSRLNVLLNETETKIFSIAHSRPSYAGRGVDESVKAMDNCNNINFISVTESATEEWNKLSNRIVGHNVFKGSFGLRVLDKITDQDRLNFNYDNPKGIIVARIDPVKNFGQFNQISDNTPNMDFYAWALLIPCGQKTYDELRLTRFTKGNLHYELNQDVIVKEDWIKENCPMTFSTSISENGGTTCLESMMYGLPICVVGHKENGCAKYVLEGKKVSMTDDYIITEHGIYLYQNGHAHISFKDALDYAIQNNAFNSYAIRNYFKENYSFNQAAIDNLMNLV